MREVILLLEMNNFRGFLVITGSLKETVTFAEITLAMSNQILNLSESTPENVFLSANLRQSYVGHFVAPQVPQ